jgi:glycosyltransferase involved in cell wall biosynthesis
MRVLQLISSSGFYGADNVIIELSKKLSRASFFPVVGVFNNLRNPHLEVAEAAKQYNLPVAVFPCKGKLDFRTILLLRRYLEENQIDIIHTHGYKSNLYALAASCGRRLPRVATCHNWLGDDPKMKLYARMDKFFLDCFDRVIAVSDTVEREILRCKISSEKVMTIGNGVEIEKFDKPQNLNGIRREFGIEEGCKVIGTVGRLSEEKGHQHFLKAAEKVLQKYRKIVFLIVGDGPLRQRLEAASTQTAKKICAKSGCPQVHFIFTGVRTDMPAVYSLLDVFVLPSLTEGLPMVLLEAMASRRPVVATTVGAVPMVIEQDRSGLLIRPADADALAEAILSLLGDPQKAGRLAGCARRRVQEEFSSGKMAEKYMDVYRKVVQNIRPAHDSRSLI